MKDNIPGNSVYDTAIKLILLLGIITWCILIIYPFASIILWSLILVIAFHPLHSKLSGKLKGKPKLASAIIIVSILLIIILPASVIIDHLIKEVKILKISYDSGNLKIPPPSESVKEWPVIGEQFFSIWLSAFSNLEDLILKYKDQLFEYGSFILNGILGAAKGVVQIIISLFIAGVILSRNGITDSMNTFFRKVGGDIGDEISGTITKTINSVVKGVIGEALILALMNGIVFLIAGVPYAGIWAFIVFILAVLQIPVYLVTVPVMIYFFAVKDITPAIVWTILLLLVSLSDNFLTPLMLGKNAPVPMPVIFIGVIGGCILSGFIGIFTGAILISVGYTLLMKWITPEKLEAN